MRTKTSKFNPRKRWTAFVSAMALMVTFILQVGMSWAWFSDERSASLSQIQASSWENTASIIPYAQPMALAMSLDDSAVTEPVMPTDVKATADGSYQLKPGNYVLTLGRSADSTASTGYCTIQTASSFTAHTGNLTEPITILLNILPLEEGDYETPDTLVITSSWGTYENNGSTGFSLVTPLCLEDGMIVNTLGEILTEIPVMDLPYVPSYTALVEHDIPLYFQNGYTNNRYGAGTIASDGCGVVSLAMIANYLTGYEYDIVDLARWFGGTAENNIARFEKGATTLGLPWEKAENIDKATEAVQNGKIVVMMMDGFEAKNPFTTSQHFIIVRGVTTDGRYLVQDSNSDNYSKWELKTGFEKGFTRQTLVEGYSGAWIFDTKLPEGFQPYVKVEAPRQNNYPSVNLTFEEQKLIAKVIFVEAQGEPDEGQQAVAEVILNRLVSGKFGSSVKSIIYAENQFRSVPKLEDATPWQAQYDALDAALYGVPILDKDVYYFATEPMTDNVFITIGGHVFCKDEIVPNETVPEATEPEETVPETTVPEETVPVTTVPEETVPETTVPEETVPLSTDPVETEPTAETQSDNTEPHEIPVFYQSDYAAAAYGDGTIGEDGSGIVSLAMVANYLTKYNYTPDLLAEWFVANGEDEINRLNGAISTLKLPCVQTQKQEEAGKAAEENKILILRLESTEGAARFLVIRGVTADGKLLINDPCKENYEKDQLADGFENGFSPEEVLPACTHAWIFDPEGLSEDFVPYTK